MTVIVITAVQAITVPMGLLSNSFAHQAITAAMKWRTHHSAMLALTILHTWQLHNLTAAHVQRATIAPQARPTLSSAQLDGTVKAAPPITIVMASAVQVPIAVASRSVAAENVRLAQQVTIAP